MCKHNRSSVNDYITPIPYTCDIQQHSQYGFSPGLQPQLW